MALQNVSARRRRPEVTALQVQRLKNGARVPGNADAFGYLKLPTTQRNDRAGGGENSGSTCCEYRFRFSLDCVVDGVLLHHRDIFLATT